jgi:hypothetical protein
MGMDLYGDHGDERVNCWRWQCILLLGLKYGWEPRGTEPPDPENSDHEDSEDEDFDDEDFDHEDSSFEDFDPKEWDGNYDSNCGQTVTADDAAALANAVERALPDIPNHVCGSSSDVFKTLFETLSGPEEKNRLIEIIAFLRKGSFAIF